MDYDGEVGYSLPARAPLVVRNGVSDTPFIVQVIHFFAILLDKFKKQGK